MEMMQIRDLKTLVSTPDLARDERWELEFFDRLLQSEVHIVDSRPQLGPDGFSYLLVQSNGETAGEPAVKVIEWLAQKGVGLVVNPEKDYPDYVFHYGMLWHYKERQRFFDPQAAKVEQGAFSIESGAKVKTGEPSPEYLPAYVREVLREFFKQQKIDNPKLLMVSPDGVNYDMCFSLESLGSPAEADHATLAEAISWFLPSHYSVGIVSEEGLPEFFPV